MEGLNIRAQFRRTAGGRAAVAGQNNEKVNFDKEKWRKI
jgi:hypothetical protein